MFKTIKHSKIKNTGLIYQVLIRQIITEGINNKDVKSLEILKSHFKKNSQLYKQLQLYKMLKQSKFDNQKKADQFIQKILEFRTRLDNKKIKNQKYSCVKQMIDKYDIKQLFSIPIQQYKTYASIYKLFQSACEKNMYNPTNIVQSRYNITTQLLANNSSKTQNSDQILEQFKKQSKQIKTLALRQLIKNYNKKYSSLNTQQRNVLKQYINNITNHNSMNQYIHKMIPLMNSRIKTLLDGISNNDEVLKIKLVEVKNNMSKVNNIKTIDDKVYTVLNILQLLKQVQSMEKNL